MLCTPCSGPVTGGYARHPSIWGSGMIPLTRSATCLPAVSSVSALLTAGIARLRKGRVRCGVVTI